MLFGVAGFVVSNLYAFVGFPNLLIETLDKAVTCFAEPDLQLALSHRLYTVAYVG